MKPKMYNPELEEQGFVEMPQQEFYSVSQPVNHYKYRLYGPMGGPQSYVHLMEMIETMGPEDSIEIKINGPGGDLATAAMIIDAIDECQGTVITHCSGQAASAHSLILLAGHQIKISPNAIIMAHDGSGGSMYRAKLSESRKSIEAYSELIKKLYHRLYKPIMTEEQIDRCLDASDVWMLGDEAMEKLMDYASKLQQAEEETNEMDVELLNESIECGAQEE